MATGSQVAYVIDITKFDANLAGGDVKDLTFQLLTRPLYVPDAVRDYKPLIGAIRRILAEPGANLMAVRSAESLVGTYGIINVVPGADARFVCWFWDRSAVTPGLVKAARDFIAYSKEFHALKRVTAQSACKELSRFLEMVGFKVEGRFRHGMKWDGRFHNLFQLRVIGEV